MQDFEAIANCAIFSVIWIHTDRVVLIALVEGGKSYITVNFDLTRFTYCGLN